MDLEVRLTREPLERELERLGPPWTPAMPAGRLAGRGALAGEAGAWLDFYGIVRSPEDPGHECGPPREGAPGAAPPSSTAEAAPFAIRALEYEAHESMAVHQTEKILRRLGEAHGLSAALVLHRLGVVPVGEASLLVRLLSPHRGEALRACAEFIDDLKRWVPIWKHPLRPEE